MKSLSLSFCSRAHTCYHLKHFTDVDKISMADLQQNLSQQFILLDIFPLSLILYINSVSNFHNTQKQFLA
jgi:hypothetical protein